MAHGSLEACTAQAAYAARVLALLLLPPRVSLPRLRGLPEPPGGGACPVEPCRRAAGAAWEAARLLLSSDPLEAAREYTRLFVAAYPGPRCPPYESLYRGYRFTGEPRVVAPLEALLREAGLEVDPEAGADSPEHAAAELELAYALLESGGGLPGWLAERLAAWLPRLASCMGGEARLAAYRAAAGALALLASCLGGGG